MLEIIRDKVRVIRHGLTGLDSQPIGKAALTVVIFLDLFILMSVFQGLSDHTSQLTEPGEYIPQHCRDVVIDRDWNETNRLVRIARIVSNYHGSYLRVDERDRSKPEHPVCAPITGIIRSIEDDRELSVKLSDFLRLRKETVQARSEFKRVKGVYDTALLGEISNGSGEINNTASLGEQVSKMTDTLDSLVQREGVVAASILQDRQISRLFGIIDASSESEREFLLAELRSRNFWHPVKRLGMEMLFLLPLVVIFYLWNSRSVSGKRPFQVLVSSHLLVVVFIPVFFKIVELVYDIVPKKFLKHIIELLESLKLVAVWHYLLMGVSILAALVLIYFFQKKLFSHEKLVEKRIAKGLCQDCGAHLPAGSHACPLCGFNQFRQCGHCNKDTYIYGKYCKECGGSE